MTSRTKGSDLRLERARLSLVANPHQVPSDAAPSGADPTAAEFPHADLPYVVPEVYGLRVPQTPEEALHAAEFLVATRLQEEARGRLARVHARLRAERAQHPDNP